MKFWDFYKIIYQRRMMIAGLMIATLAGIYINTADDKPYYTATVQMMPTDAALFKPILLSPNLSMDGQASDNRSDSQMPNLMSLVKSREVSERTIRLINMKEDPDHLRNRISVGTVPNPGARSRDDRGTDIIEVTINDLEPSRAVRTVNTLAHVYSSFYQEISHQEASDNRRFLESERMQVKRNLEEATERLTSFKRQNRITSTTDINGSEAAGLRQAKADLDNARAALAEAQAKLSQVNRQISMVGPTRKVEVGTSDTPMVQQLESQLAEMTRKLNDARSKYEDTHPQVVAIIESIDQIERKLSQERGRMKTSVTVIRNPVYEDLLQQKSRLSYERDGYAAKVSQLSIAVARASGELKPGMDVTIARLENDFQSAQAAYTNLQTQLNQARINEKETTDTGAIRIIDEAVAATGPIGTNRGSYFILGAILSLILGSGLAITMAALDNRINTNIDVEKLLGIGTTALIPSSPAGSESSLARITHTDPLSPLAEAYRFLRTDLLLSTQSTGEKSIMVATAKPGQGGTCTAANLGISLAIDGKKVILVDADMRRPCLHRIFKVQNDFGLSNVLTNEKDMEEVLVATEIENLLILPAGSTPSNPSELLGSARMRSIVSQLSEHADFVIFDTPSVMAFTDAVVLSQVVDGVILVVRAQQVPRGSELQVRNLLNKANAKILGVVLNDVQPELVDSYHYHSHYYPDMTSKKNSSLQIAGKSNSLSSKETQN
ncbi:MAG: GumC family protein [Armatimonadota bacterium]